MESISNKSDLLKGSLLLKNILWVLLGKILPIVVAIFCIPILIEDLGDARFGLLTIIWVIIGFASVLDLGLGRAAIKFISEKIGQKKEREIAGIFWVAFILIGSMGILLGFLLYVFDDVLVTRIFEIEDSLHEQARLSIIYTAFILPIVFCSSVLTAVLKAYQEFKIITLVQGGNSILNYLVPLLILIFIDTLSVIIAALLIIKVISFLIFFGVLFQTKSEIFNFDFKELEKNFKPVLKFGGWVTVSNIISPVLDYWDRFLIASVITVAAVTYYATPLDIIVKISAVSVSFVSVLFPAISNAITNNKNKTRIIIDGGLASITSLMFPILLFISFFSFEILEFWINAEIAEKSSIILKIFCVGFFLKSLTHIPYAFLHSNDNPDLAAKIHLTELFFYGVVLIISVKFFGITGAAIAHSLRLLVDYILMSVYADKQFERDKIFQKFFVMTIISVFILGLSFILQDLIVRLVAFATIIVLFCLVMWRYKISDQIKMFIKNRIQTLLSVN